MTIVVKKMLDHIEIKVYAVSQNEFAELVQRGSNLWPDASPDIKMFADEITNNGVHMQDYTRPTVTNQPKFCTTLLAKCPSGCKGSSCSVKQQLTQIK